MDLRIRDQPLNCSIPGGLSKKADFVLQDFSCSRGLSRGVSLQNLNHAISDDAPCIVIHP